MNLAAYNNHKRKTLDRVTAMYTDRLKRNLRWHLQTIAADFEKSLESGKKSFEPLDGNFTEASQKVMVEHRQKVINVGVADGIQEVSPTNELGAWERFPLSYPIEKTLTVELAGKANKTAKKIIKKIEKRKIKSIPEVIKSLLDQHKSTIKRAYAEASKDWLAGEGSKEQVNAYLREVLKVSASAAERIVRTETTEHFNEARHEYFATNTSVDYVQIFAITDGRTSEICDSRHGYVVSIADAKLKKNMPPFHPNCRTVQRPLLSYLPSHKLIIEKGLKMDERKFAALPAGWG